MSGKKSLEASLVLVLGCIFLYFKYENSLILEIGFVLGLVGIFIKPLAMLIARFWFKLGDVMGAVVSRILLTVIYSIFLIPLALTYRLFNRDPLQLKSNIDSYWKERNHSYTASDIDKPW